MQPKAFSIPSYSVFRKDLYRSLFRYETEDKAQVLQFPGKEQGCVLLVEDSWHDLLLMSYVLDEQGLRGSVQCARSGKDALKILDMARTTGKPQLNGMIIDLSLPDMHGSELVDAVRHDPFFEGLPVIVFSGSTTGLSERERKSLKGAALAEKPIQFSQFQETFISLLRSLLEPGEFERATA